MELPTLCEYCNLTSPHSAEKVVCQRRLSPNHEYETLGQKLLLSGKCIFLRSCTEIRADMDSQFVDMQVHNSQIELAVIFTGFCVSIFVCPLPPPCPPTLVLIFLSVLSYSPPHASPPTNPPFPVLVPPLPLPLSLCNGSTRKHARACTAHAPPPPAVLDLPHTPPLFPFTSFRIPSLPVCPPPPTPHTHTPPSCVCNSATRRRRESSGRPEMISLMVKGRMRKTGEMEWRRKTTTTLSTAGCARMEGSCFAVTPAPPPITSTASILPYPKSPMANGSAPAAR